MPRARVLVTLTAEAVVDLPPDVDVEAYVRERVALAWGGVPVARLVHAPAASVEWFEAGEGVDVEDAGEITAGSGAETESPEGAVAGTASAIGSAIGLVASIVGGIKESLIGGGGPAEDVREPAPAADAEPEPEPVASVEAERPPEAVADAQQPANGDRVLDRDELLALFDDPLYADLIRSAVRGRAEALLEGMVAQVVSELEPLLRRHLERHGA